MSIPEAFSNPNILPCDIIPCGPVLVPLLVSVMMSCTLLGEIVVLSIAAHWGRTLATQTVLVLIVLVQLGQTAADMARLIRRLGLYFGQVGMLVRTGPLDAAAVFLGVLCQLHTQAFLLARALKYASLASATPFRWPGAGLVGAVIGASAVCGFGVAILTDTLGSFEELLPISSRSLEFKVFIQAWLISSTVVDCVLAASITYELVRARKWSSDRTTTGAWVRAIARRLVLVVLHSGAALAVVQTATLVLWRMEMDFIDSKDSTAYVFLTLNVLPKIYTLTFLVILLCMPPPRPAPTDNATPKPVPPAPPAPPDNYTSFVLPLSHRSSARAPRRLTRVAGQLPQPFADGARSPRSIVIHSGSPEPAAGGPATAHEHVAVVPSPENSAHSLAAQRSIHLSGVQGTSFADVSPCSATGLFPILAYQPQPDSPSPVDSQPSITLTYATNSEAGTGSVRGWSTYSEVSEVEPAVAR